MRVSVQQMDLFTLLISSGTHFRIETLDVSVCVDNSIHSTASSLARLCLRLVQNDKENFSSYFFCGEKKKTQNEQRDYLLIISGERGGICARTVWVHDQLHIPAVAVARSDIDTFFLWR